MKKISYTILILFAMIKVGYAQESLMHLQVNPAKQNQEITLRNQQPPSPILLPFHEDFSYPGPYPDPALWADNFVFVNSSFAVHPMTVGVATFDALDQYGNIYEHVLDQQFIADYLTTHPIRLDSVFNPLPAKLTPADSVLLTFYFQPQGIGGNPTEVDSLVLQFLHTPGHYAENQDGENQWVDDLWVSMWNAPGSSLADFSDSFPFFKRVAIPVTDEVFFRSDFRFRFLNYSKISTQVQNLAGNNRIWNIDYITLDHGRSTTDLAYYDIAFAAPAASMLRHYTSMPWSHYIVNPQSHLKSNFSLRITNLDNLVHNYSYHYAIKDENDFNVKTYTGGQWNIAPFRTAGYQTHAPHAQPIVIPNPLPTAQAPSRNFKIVHMIKEGASGDAFPRNDTIIYHQEFSNYFAYDDGVPEGSYGVQGVRPKTAYRFTAAKPDSLQGVKFFFNRTSGNQNQKPFILTVWNKVMPYEQILYQSSAVTPEFNEGLNQFVTYWLDEPIFITDTFYVGWQQTGTNEFLAVGFDLNNNSRQNIFVSINGQWGQSIMEGSLMIRPVVGSSSATSINEPQVTNSIQLFPNPVRGQTINIHLDEQFHQGHDELFVEIFDIQGRLTYYDRFTPAVEVATLPNGLYFLKVTNRNTGKSSSLRFLISR
jgi:hypothetical protein